MFSIDSTGTIRITKGTDSGDFNLTLFSADKHGFEKQWLIEPIEIKYHSNYLFFDLDKEKFKEKVKFSGWYCFEYTYPITPDGEYFGQIGWYLDQPVGSPEAVSLADYGITCKGTPKLYDRLVIKYGEFDIDSVIFKIKDIQQKSYIFEKKFSSDSETLVSDRGDVVLNLTAEDLEDFDVGEYRYQIFIQQAANEFTDTKAITKILPFYIL